MSKQFAVIGMGRVGAALVETLDSLGHDFLGIDCDAERIQDLSAELPGANLIAADATEGTVLRDLGLENFDGAAVVIGNNDQAGVLVTLILKDLNVPLVIARASSRLHARVLDRVGADHVVEPEREFGEFLARRISTPGVLDYLELGHDEAIIEMKVPQKWVGKTLGELHLPREKGLTVLVIKPEGKEGVLPRANAPLNEGDVLLVGGLKKVIDKIDT